MLRDRAVNRPDDVLEAVIRRVWRENAAVRCAGCPHVLARHDTLEGRHPGRALETLRPAVPRFVCGAGGCECRHFRPAEDDEQGIAIRGGQLRELREAGREP